MHRSSIVIAGILALSIASYWTVLAEPAVFRSHTSLPQATETPSLRVINVSAKKYEFTPNEIDVKEGEKIELKVHSEDETHGVKIDAYPEGAKAKGDPGLVFTPPGQNGKVEKGVDQVVDFTAQEPGTYDFKCAKICGMGHGKMKGKVIVAQ
jgi:cytochrome c oxidase subunit II